jgi:hypothetical protein
MSDCEQAAYENRIHHKFQHHHRNFVPTFATEASIMSSMYPLANASSEAPRGPFASMAEVRIMPPVIIRTTRFAYRVQAKGREDDWTGTTDAAARRKAQTRLNTRAYRKSQDLVYSDPLWSKSGSGSVQLRGSYYPIIEANNSVGKRKALAKKAEAPSTAIATGTVIKSERLVECWVNEQQSVCVIPESRAKHLYNARNPLLPHKPSKEHFQFVFPLCPDHLITLLQFNATRALAANRTLISGILVTPLDCGTDEGVIHVIPYPTKPQTLPSALLPTTLQQTVPHGDWIDLFPCPDARDRLIHAAGTFDEDELFADCSGGLYEGFPDDEVERRGLIAWSPPWDISGWEMSEGFLRKWGWVFKGLPGPLEATNRWRRERGDEPIGHED